MRTKTVTLPLQNAIVEQMHSQGAAREVLPLKFCSLLSSYQRFSRLHSF